MGAWGTESCSNDLCWDALSVFNNIHDIEQEEVGPCLKVIFGAKMKWNAMVKLGSVIWVLRQGLEVPKKYLEKALPLVDECLGNVEEEGWRDPESRITDLHQEREDIKRALASGGKIKPKHTPGLIEKITGTMPGQEETAWGPDKSHAPNCSYRNQGECDCPKSERVEDDKNRFRNFYRCEECGHEWVMDWSCCCDDRCPECNAAMEPFKSVDLECHRSLEEVFGSAAGKALKWLPITSHFIKDDVDTYLEMALWAMDINNFYVLADRLDLSDEELARLREQLDLYLNKKEKSDERGSGG